MDPHIQTHETQALERLTQIVRIRTQWPFVAQYFPLRTAILVHILPRETDERVTSSLFTDPAA